MPDNGHLNVNGQDFLVYDDTGLQEKLDTIYDPTSGKIKPSALPDGYGATGPTGPAGMQGPVGPAGAKGATGATGAIGPTGSTGATGAQGPKGDSGQQGAAGVEGPKGATGSTGVTGLQGVTGATGATGATGLQGATGATGVTGATGLQGATGATGQQGPAGPAGQPGQQGPAGQLGPQGPVGPQGPQGSIGPQGPPGQNAGAIGSALSYVIELSRWGIVAGIPTKPYTDANYVQADKNVQGINNALQWAATNGYNYVLMPRGDYAICYPRTIMITQSSMTVDFNSSILKVIYDSTRKSPFDTRTGVTDYYNFPGKFSNGQDGVSIKLQSVTNSHVKNLVLIGCKADRSFIATAEASIEWTYGIQIVRGSSYCTVSNSKISSYMGDGISLDSTGYYDYAEFGLGLTVNDIDRQTGALIPTNGKTLTSQLLTIPTTGYDSFLVAGAGYSRQTAINTKEVDVAYYGADNTYLGNYSNKKIYTPISIPPTARKFRFIFNNETSTTKNMQMTLKFGLTPHHNTIEYNEVYNIHRGGITLGGNYNTVQNNMIHDGTGALDRKPLFTDPTRYGINQEDSYGDNCIIRNNVLYNLYHGILAGCWTIEIHNNHFYNLGGIGINLYTLHMANITQNYLYRCQTGVGLMTAHLPNAHVNIESNTIIYTNKTSFESPDYIVHFHKNTLIDLGVFVMLDDDRHLCRDNHFIWTEMFSGLPTIMVNRIENCTFESSITQREMYFRTYFVQGTVMVNMNLRLETRHQKTKAETVEFHDCRFNKCLLNNHVSVSLGRTVLVNKSALTDTIIKIGGINNPDYSPVTQLINCNLDVTSITYLFISEFNTGYGWIEVENSRIEIANSGFAYLLTNIFNVISDTVSLFIKESRISYTGAGRLSLQYYNNANKKAVKLFGNIRNTYFGIALPGEEADIYIDYDPKFEGYAPPNSGIWFKGDTFSHANPVSGGYIGWVCIIPGIANATAWSASTVKAKGDRISAGGKVFETIGAGTTGGTTPTWPTVSPLQVNDGTVIWQEIGSLPVFKPYGSIM
ncbi:right-handed parallel beta-helix repeat-containing protein [Paenibacillus sp. LHD-117]|uniref:right-handed parallel beta-helix repeat-containing protein n=1 Tax=Paenibacillus sp. LHD-117 TaxID=3071412 RepID=UPI0027E0933C|nr:right-handed parallel beta-helix repeat-containing protein [Paenibacillus sp. LHD-117]MDQ6423254.1 right-handed parallel beta-helix repeat-containing protein [Paenibacillus sp. LHD-117]